MWAQLVQASVSSEKEGEYRLPGVYIQIVIHEARRNNYTNFKTLHKAFVHKRNQQIFIALIHGPIKCHLYT